MTDDQTTSHPDVLDLSYEAARDELVGIVHRLESGQLGLEESIRMWERGEALAAHCASWLDGAQQRLRTAVAAEESSAEPSGSRAELPIAGPADPGSDSPTSGPH